MFTGSLSLTRTSLTLLQITVSPYIITVASIYARRGFVSCFLVESTPVTGPILSVLLASLVSSQRRPL
ncbi:hypothetical protein EV424DRAFT_1430083, partial [Suillus variegatus]